MKSWQLEASLYDERKNCQLIDKQMDLDLEEQKRYTFKIDHKLQKFYALKLVMIGSNKSGRYYICLHYFNLHGNFYNEDKQENE